jgi:YfiH family protein
MIEYYKPSIFEGYPIFAGMSMRGNPLSFPPNGFSFRQLASINDEDFAKHREALEHIVGSGIGKTIISPNQVHGSDILSAEEACNKEADGLFTKNHSLTITISLADCGGIMMYDPINHVIIALHAGWRGVKKGIPERGIEVLNKTYGTHPQDLLIWLTPCAGIASYEVGAEFKSYFPEHVKELSESKYHLDLQGAIKDALIKNGARTQNIEATNICTISDTTFHSYRRDGDMGRNVGFMTIMREK